MPPLKKFTPEGHENYKNWLLNAKVTPQRNKDQTIMNQSVVHTNSDGNAIDLNIKSFDTALQFTEHLYGKLAGTNAKREIEVNRILDDPLIADWIVYAYFEHLCKVKDGCFDVGELAVYTLDFSGRQKIYRHRVAGRLALFKQYYKLNCFESKARLYLASNMNEFSKPMDVVSSKEQVLLNSNLISILDELYWDTEEGKPKKGCVSTKHPLKPGSLYRFMGPNSFYDQHYLTYDFRTMSVDEIKALMEEDCPGEFALWFAGTPGDEEINTWLGIAPDDGAEEFVDETDVNATDATE